VPRLLTTTNYERQFLKSLRKHPDVWEPYSKTLKILEVNPQHPSLRLHKLHGKLKEYYSVSINLKYRIMLDIVIQDDLVILISIGGHREQNM